MSLSQDYAMSSHLRTDEVCLLKCTPREGMNPEYILPGY